MAMAIAMDKVVFSHGQDSGPWGTKIRALADVARGLDWAVESLDYQGIQDPLARVDKLVTWCKEQATPVVMVGSSMGGYVANAAASQVGARGLFLMAPAFYMPGYEEYMPAHPDCPASIVHGWRDDIVPWKGSVRYGVESGASLTLIDGDHRLTECIEMIGVLFAAFLNDLK
jgi:predicted alpha/beta-hydrolase family hydrolase